MNAIISRTIGNTEEIAYRSYAATAEIVTAWTREGDAEGKISQIVNPNVTGVCVDVSVEPRPDVAVHALVIPDVPPAGSHPSS